MIDINQINIQIAELHKQQQEYYRKNNEDILLELQKLNWISDNNYEFVYDQIGVGYVGPLFKLRLSKNVLPIGTRSLLLKNGNKSEYSGEYKDIMLYDGTFDNLGRNYIQSADLDLFVEFVKENKIRIKMNDELKMFNRFLSEDIFGET